MECYLLLAEQTPLDFLGNHFFPDGFPAKLQITGMPERFKRSCGTIFWKLNVPAMTDLQKRAILNYYHHSVKTQRTDWTPLIQSIPGFAEQAGFVDGLFTSVISAEPPNAAIVFVEGVPSISDYCICKDFWEQWMSLFLTERLKENLLRLEQKRQQKMLANAVQMPPLLKRPNAEVFIEDMRMNHSPTGL